MICKKCGRDTSLLHECTPKYKIFDEDIHGKDGFEIISAYNRFNAAEKYAEKHDERNSDGSDYYLTVEIEGPSGGREKFKILVETVKRYSVVGTG